MTATVINSLSVPDAACTFAGMGIKVFPVYTSVTPDGRGKVTKPVPETGLLEATTDRQRITDWWTRHPNAGVGVVPGSYPGMLIVDADGAAEREFISQWLGAPTVLTPSTDADGHGGGGHWWVFGLDPVLVQELHIDAAHRVRLGDKSLAVELIGAGNGNAFTYAPPTVRQGRDMPYRFVSEPINAHQVPEFVQWLEQLRAVEVRERAERIRRARERLERYDDDDDNDDLNDWLRDTTWETLLNRNGWTFAGVASCGCGQWVHPYGATNTIRSAIAHIEGCDRSQSSFVGGGLKIFSSTARNELNGNEMLSKFDFVAWSEYDGSYGAARKAEGIHRDGVYGDSGHGFSPYSLMKQYM